MHSPTLSTAVRRMRSLAAPPADGLSDRELLKRFIKSRDEAAFGMLVNRHGPTVLGVCRRVLNNSHDAEEAFQATFLVLARRAASIRKTASVGCWLYGVAFRVASKLKSRLARTPRTGNLPDVAADSPDDVSWREVRRVLDEEVNRLPERLRLPVLLCYFEGKTRDEAAEALGWKLSTLRGRLEDGRLRLRARLARRGIELSVALLAISAATNGSAVDAALVELTIRSVAGHAAQPIKSLANGIAMSGVVGKAPLTVAAMVLFVGLSATLFTFRGQAGDQPQPASKSPDQPLKQPAKDEGDFQLKLRDPKAQLRAGDVPDLVCDLKFTGKEKRSVHSASEFAGVELDGNWYYCHRDGSIEGRTHELAPESDNSAWLTVKPDKQWIHLRDKRDADDSAVKQAVPFQLTAGRHRLRITYSFSKTERAVSNAVTIEVGADGWGEPSRGVKARLRLAKTKLKPGEPLVFELDLKNNGSKNRTLLPIPFNCEIEMDGRWYIFHGAIDYKTIPKELKPGGELAPFMAVTADERWKTNRWKSEKPEVKETDPAFEFLAFKLTPGKHKVRVSFPIDGAEAEPSSNTVEIEVAGPPLDPVVKALALEADRIWVVNAPTREKPVPAAEQVLKGPPLPEMSLFDLRLLPGDDPKKKFIVFLKADDNAAKSPEVKLWPAEKWYEPYTNETADAIRLALLPDKWGEEKSGLRMGLRLRKPIGTIGQPVVAEVVVENNGVKDWTLAQHRFNIYDYWPDTWFEVIAPDGKKWELRKQVGAIKESDNPSVITLKPGESYVQTVRLDAWPAHTDWLKSSEPLPNLFTKPGEYAITAHYRYSPPMGMIGTWTADFASASEKLVIKGIDDWGEASGGVKSRLRLTKTKFKAGEAMVFALDLKNVGDKSVEDYPVCFHCQIELDGTTYRYTAPVSVPTSLVKLEPGKEYSAHVQVTTDEWWRDNRGNLLTLTPGKHKVKVTYPLTRLGENRVISQAVEFEVDADKK